MNNLLIIIKHPKHTPSHIRPLFSFGTLHCVKSVINMWNILVIMHIWKPTEIYWTARTLRVLLHLKIFSSFHSQKDKKVFTNISHSTATAVINYPHIWPFFHKETSLQAGLYCNLLIRYIQAIYFTKGMLLVVSRGTCIQSFFKWISKSGFHYTYHHHNYMTTWLL